MTFPLASWCLHVAELLQLESKNLSLALVESGKTKQPESVVRKIRSNPDFKLKVEQAMNVYPLTRQCWDE